MSKNLNQPGEVAALLSEVDQALAALSPQTYDETVRIVNGGFRERFLAELRHPLNNEVSIASVGALISARCDAYLAAHDKNPGWYPRG